MAATAAVSGVLGRLGWRLLQLRCLPGEVTAKPGRGGESGEGGTGWIWAWRGTTEAVVGASKVKGIGVEPLESRAGKRHLWVSVSGLEL